MIDPMHGPREKLARSQEHMAAFAQGATHLPPIALSWRNDLEPADEPDTFYMNLHVRELAAVPARLSLILGDAVQNLRASLDYIVWQLALHATPDARPSRRLQFPICDTPLAFEVFAKDRLALLPEHHIDALADCQPCVSHRLAALSRLHALAIADKHHALVITAWAADMNDSRLLEVTGCDRAEPQYLVDAPLEAGMVLLRIKVWNPRQPLGLKMLFDWRPHVAFAGGGRVERILNDSAAAVQNVIDELAYLLEESRL